MQAHSVLIRISISQSCPFPGSLYLLYMEKSGTLLCHDYRKSYVGYLALIQGGDISLATFCSSGHSDPFAVVEIIPTLQGLPIEQAHHLNLHHIDSARTDSTAANAWPHNVYKLLCCRQSFSALLELASNPETAHER